MNGPRIGSLFSGYGGLDMGAMEVLGGEVVWHVEFDDAPSKILAHHWPDVPNYGDVTKVDWSKVPPVDVLTGGFPCQDLSLAGRRAGMRPGTRSGLWGDYVKAIDALRPGLVVIENVRGLLSGCAESEADSELGSCPRCADPDSGVGHAPNVRALGRVLLDLARIGYVGRWAGVRAADAGAPHGRFRVFVVAYPGGGRGRWGAVASGHREGTRANPPTDGANPGAHGTPPAYAGCGGCEVSTEQHGEPIKDPTYRTAPGEHVDGHIRRADAAWGDYAPAIARWEHVLGRVAPPPTAPDGRNGQHRLAPRFVEWMMGLPAGHVTNPDIGLTRAQELKALGNGVVPQQAALALRLLGVGA